MYVERPSVYTPGAGHRPPVLAGRDELVRAWQLMLNDVEARGRVGARDTILAGPRGIGKTATVFKYGDLAREQGYEIVNLQAAAGTATLIDSLVRQAERRAGSGAGPWQRVKHAFERIASINVNVAGFGGGIATHPPDDATRGGVAPEDLADALAQLAHEVRVDHPRGGVLITVDEMQSAAGADLALLAAALQRLNGDHPDARVLFAGTGLPHITDVLAAAGVTHADRLLYIRQLPLTLSEQDALYAIVEPAREAQVSWHPDAAALIVQATNGYPAHLQLFADHAWRCADDTSATITLPDAQRAAHSASQELEERTLAPWVERLTGRQAELLTAIAVNNGRATRSEITITLARGSADTLSRTRSELLALGDIYVPRYGEMALTTPLLGPYLIDHYQQIRSRATAPLLPLEEMQRNVQAIAANRATQEPTTRRPTR